MTKAKNDTTQEVASKTVTLADLVTLDGVAFKQFEVLRKSADDFLELVTKESKLVPVRHLAILRRDMNRPFIEMLRSRVPSKKERLADRISKLQARLEEELAKENQ